MHETRRINVYGKRSTRIVSIKPNDRVDYSSPFASHGIPHETDVTHSPSALRKRLLVRKVHGHRTSPRGSPKSSNILGKAMSKTVQDATTPRRPLVTKLANVSDTPTIMYYGERRGTSPIASPTKLSRFTPFMDPDASTVEKPIARRNDSIRGSTSCDDGSGATEVVRPARKRAQRRTVIITDDEDEEVDESLTKRPLRGAQANPIVISDDSSDGSPVVAARVSQQASEQQQSLKNKQRRIQAETPHSNSSNPIRANIPKPIIARPPSPRRSQRNILLPSKTQNQSKPTLIAESEVVIYVAKPKQKSAISSNRGATNLGYLMPLLKECSQKTPLSFCTFIEEFPFNDVHGRRTLANLSYRKIGEASYSEVFGIGNVVLKVVPLRNESAETVDLEVDMPHESEVKDVLQEIIVTREMGQTCRGFVKLLSAHVVTGTYPSILLSLWDQFNQAKGAENIRPDIFPQSQAFAVLVLPHGGPDLETYTFPIKTGWRQACSIFWQTTNTLAIAEDLVSFEHRDLHWGQILVGCTRQAPEKASVSDKTHMNDPSHGVTATIIDLGLARMDSKDGAQVHWTAFDDLIFQGEGDYQFDVYRMMQRLHGDTWDRYRPLTNVMWLHYLLSKLLHAKRLRPPGKRSITTDGEFGEKQCYECLLDMEQRLNDCILQTRGKKGRGVGTKVAFTKAGDVMKFARDKGWVS